MVNQEIILAVEHLKMWLKVGETHLRVVDDINFTLRKGQTLAILGESGCGKTMLALSLLQLQPRNGYFSKTSHIFYQRKNLLECSDVEMQAIRGKKIAMIFQEPMTSLNPVLTIYQQLAEAIYHCDPRLSKKALQHRTIKLLEEVKLPDPHYYCQLYPHQLSGGMKQRVMIAIALAANPDILIADEPTTALDVTTQMQILELLMQLQQVHQMSIILITHDLGIVQEISDTVAVMYAGEFVEQATTEDYFKQPSHPYSRQLFQTLPKLSNRSNRLMSITGIVPTLDQAFPLCRFKARCSYKTDHCEQQKPCLQKMNEFHYSRCLQSVDYLNSKQSKLQQQAQALPHIKIKDSSILDIKNLIVTYAKHKRLFRESSDVVTAVNDLTLLIKDGQTLALAGESGCGKTTVAKSILKLLRNYQGKISLYDKNIKDISDREQYSKAVQVIFQDPFSSLDPKKMVQEILLEGLLARKNNFTLKDQYKKASFLIEQVGLKSMHLSRYPHEFSGGQRQRIAIARALSLEPKLIICDEPTSALDVSIQAQILNLLKEIQLTSQVSYLFISHNLSVVSYMADVIAVMKAGKIVEYGTVNDIFNKPQHDYTKQLLASVPYVH